MKNNFNEKIIVFIHATITVIGVAYLISLICKLVYYYLKK